jgi:hypothetical protein
MSYTTPRTWVTGELVTDTLLNAHLRDNLNAAFPLGVGAWTSYTPTNTNVTVGNGTQIAVYQRIGRLIVVQYDLLWGSTTAFSGAPGFGLPVAVATSRRGHGTCYILDASVNDYDAGVFASSGGTTAFIRRSAGGGIDGTTPFTWTTSDRISFTLMYEAAS